MGGVACSVLPHLSQSRQRRARPSLLSQCPSGTWAQAGRSAGLDLASPGLLADRELWALSPEKRLHPWRRQNSLQPACVPPPAVPHPGL